MDIMQKKKCSFVHGIKIILVLHSYVYVIRSNELIEYIHVYCDFFFNKRCTLQNSYYLEI